ncbi:MAG: aminoacetone oxidase family FAD-binding enzyme [Candidatus Vogelbacteria bacterium]|nr:aminoacetone oxidase family FAD-binding enzyme [Candidatus Vogelbacteria bacterium]
MAYAKADNYFDVIVVGGGASGLMAAGRAAELGKKVLLLEKNRLLGEKLKITGGGRCNITNAEEDVRVLLKNYGEAEQYLYSAFAQFGVKDTFEFFGSRGLPLVVQARKRAFPNTEKALDVFRVLEKYVKNSGVTIKTASSVSQIVKDGRLVKGVVSGGVMYEGKSVILATGGNSHPETGSTGDGFKWLNNLGHKTVDPTPTLVPLAVADDWVKNLAGVSLSFMKITFYLEGKKSFSKLGKVLFTHFGLSGPLILNSAKDVDGLLRAGQVTATIDAYPDTELGDVDKKVINIFNVNKNKDLKNIFKEITPEGTSEQILSVTGVDPNKKVHSITVDERKRIVRTLKALSITIVGLMGTDRAVAVDGGVVLSEIDTKIMKSKLFDNLFVTGDLLHINRPSGGYSLQLCWTTGFVAGSNA